MSAASQNKRQFAISLIIFLILGAGLVGFHFMFSGKIKPLHFDDPPYLHTKSNRGDAVIVAREAADVEKPLAALAAGRDDEFSEMIHSERFYLVRNGTGSAVLERGTDISKIRIRDDGREGYVYNRQIVAE